MIGRSMVFDYSSRQFCVPSGVVKECTGIDAVKQWIQLALLTMPNSAAVYAISDNPVRFGVASYNLLGKRNLPAEFVQAEIENQIREVCTLNPGIDSVGGFTFTRGGNRTLKVSFTVYTATDSEEMTVDYG